MKKKKVLKKKRLLVWADSPTVQTGFGTVSKYVLKALYETGKYEIDILGINYHGKFFDRNLYPYQIAPTKLQNPKDPYGTGLFQDTIKSRSYDIVWILNDTFVVNKASKAVEEMRQIYISQGKAPPIIIYYYPVDCKILPNQSGMVTAADVPVAYTEFGVQETLKVFPTIKTRLKQIYHGVNTSVYKPLSADERRHWRMKFLRANDDCFIVTNMNRNSVRKQLTHTLLVFKEFQKIVPNSKLYLHTSPRDLSGGIPIDLLSACKDLNLNPSHDVAFPVNYSPSKGYPENVLNQFYNCGDVFLTNHLGEGFGLTIVEAMAAGLHVISPDNTNMYELLGRDKERGWLYDCPDRIWVDNSGYRKMGRTEDIVQMLCDAYDYRNNPEKMEMIKRSRQWCIEHDWREIGKRWIKLFDEAAHREVAPQDNSCETIAGDII